MAKMHFQFDFHIVQLHQIQCVDYYLKLFKQILHLPCIVINSLINVHQFCKTKFNKILLIYMIYVISFAKMGKRQKHVSK